MNRHVLRTFCVGKQHNKDKAWDLYDPSPMFAVSGVSHREVMKRRNILLRRPDTRVFAQPRSEPILPK